VFTSERMGQGVGALVGCAVVIAAYVAGASAFIHDVLPMLVR
jgi:hypothetical protein